MTSTNFQKTFGITPQQEQKLEKLLSAFLEENTKINLSAIREEKLAREKHLYDSLLGAKFLENTGNNVLDLGTGGGFPALPLAILYPEKTFYPLDSVGKKVQAVGRIAEEAGISNIQLLTGRAEELAREKQYREQFDVVVSRAAAKFPTLLELVVPFIKTGGIFLSYRGPEEDPLDELLIKKWGLLLIKKREFTLSSGEKRVLWLMKKIQRTSLKYPREVGTPKKIPLGVEEVRNG